MRKEQIQRYFNYARAYLRHNTLAKAVNLVRVESRRLRSDGNAGGIHPYFLFIDISNSCNLSCPLCQTGRKENIHRQNRLTFEKYRQILDQTGTWLYQVFLYNWGEPFLNKDIYDIIRYNTASNIGTVVSTNGTIPIDTERLVRSGLENLVISGDGITQEVYEHYRRGGDLSRVLTNLDSLVAQKKRLGSRFPHIEWQCLVTRHNEHQINDLKREVLRRGANEVRFGNINFYSVENSTAEAVNWLPTNPRFRTLAPEPPEIGSRIRKPCFWLWRTAVINADGGLTPCCLYDVPAWGNTLDGTFHETWTNGMFTQARERSRNDRQVHTHDLVCDRCDAPFIWKKTPWRNNRKSAPRKHTQ